MTKKLETRRFMGYFGWGYFFAAGLVSHEHLSLPSSRQL